MYIFIYYTGIIGCLFVAQQITKKIGTKKSFRLIAEGTIFIYVFHFALLNLFYHLFYQAMGLTMDSTVLPILQIVEAILITIFFIKPIEILKKNIQY